MSISRRFVPRSWEVARGGCERSEGIVVRWKLTFVIIVRFLAYIFDDTWLAFELCFTLRMMF